MDTGSSDLWVVANPGQQIQLTATSTLPLTDSYGQGQVSGNIDFADVEVGGFTVPGQGAPSNLLSCV